MNDYLQEDIAIRDCVHDVTPQPVSSAKGKIFLLPASLDSDRIARLLREGYQVEKLNDAMFAIADDLKLDFVLVDTHPGICLLYTSPSPRDKRQSRMPSSA